MKVEPRPRLPEGVKSYDQHGFAVFCEDTFCDSERHHPEEKINTLVNSPAHIEAWQSVLSDWSWTQINGSSRLRSLIRKGVPPSMRQELWLNLLACRNLKETSKFSYQKSVRLIRQELVDLGISEYCLKEGLLEMSGASDTQQNHVVPPQVIRQITVDVDRSFPSHRLFIDGSLEAKEGRASLFRLLAVYALYNPQVGYCQGMSYIAGMLLMQMSNEEEAFWALVALFEKPKYLSGYFDQSLLRIQQHAAVFQKLITNRLPKFARHLASMELHLLTFVTPWFMCLYTSFPCWDTVLTIWDLILLDGISTIFRVALAVLRVSQDELLQTSDMSRILPKLLHPPPELVSAETLLPVIWKMTVDKWEIDALQAIVAEEFDSKPGRKRRRHLESESDDSEQAGKRPRGEDKSEETTMFQRVLGLFRSSSSRQTQPSKMSHASRTRASNRANQTRRRTPGMAKASTQPWSMAPSIAKPFSIQDNSSEVPFVLGKAPDWKTCTEFSFAPNVVKDKSAPLTKGVLLMKSKAPDQKISTELSLAPNALAGKAALQNKKVTSSKAKVPGSVRWTRFEESVTSCSSPWREGLRALTMTLPVHDGIILSSEDTTSTELSYSKKENSLSKPTSGLVGEVETSIRSHHEITNGSSEPGTKPELQAGDEERISPCIIAAEESLNPFTTSLQKSSQRRSSNKALRFSPRFSEERGKLTSRENIRSLNTPSGRRFLSKSAKVMHSFKTFHTPTPLRKSQGCGRHSCSDYASPDLEVELQPMKLAARLKKDY
ncbi:uncharacterized protein LOC117304932 isoform X2 [Asterias rubens]|nr:uncharacterized protein LOC117304932 isoform X2 [Asterias rubens]XP_033645464.1 uncharacterized protein LOC117304932 isoform X2 [Asterias rubens]